MTNHTHNSLNCFKIRVFIIIFDYFSFLLSSRSNKKQKYFIYKDLIVSLFSITHKHKTNRQFHNNTLKIDKNFVFKLSILFIK